LARKRESALRRTALALLVGAAFIAFVPVPFHSVHHGVVWLPDESIVRSPVSGHVARVMQAPGQIVASGTPLLRLDSLTLQADLGTAAAAVAQAEAHLRKAQALEPVRTEPWRAELAARQAKFSETARKVQSFDVDAGIAGRWTPGAPTELTGRYVKRGEVLGYLVAGPSDRVRTAITQEDMDLIRSRLQGVQVRLANSPESILNGNLKRQVPGGEFDLVSPALGSSGGGEIAVDPTKEGGKHSLKRVFDMEISLDKASPGSVFGDRAFARFDLGAAPLGWQWFVRLRQVFLSQLSV